MFLSLIQKNKALAKNLSSNDDENDDGDDGGKQQRRMRVQTLKDNSFDFFRILFSS
jgi:hypothetical protein